MWGPDKRRGRRVRPKGLLQYAQQDAVANPPLALDRGSNGSLLGMADAVGQATLGGLLTGVTSAPGSDAERAMLRGSGGAVMDMTPGVGDVKALTYDAPRLFGEGHPVMGAVAAASAIPLLGMPFDAARTLMKRVDDVPDNGLLGRARPPRENLSDVVQANFNHGIVVGDETAPIGSLLGGVGPAADDAARVRENQQ